MKLAIDHIEVDLKACERQLVEAREGLKAAQRNLNERTEQVAKLIQLNADLTKALEALRPIAAQVNAKPVEKAAEEKASDRTNGTLSRRPRPDPIALKISDAR